MSTLEFRGVDMMNDSASETISCGRTLMASVLTLAFLVAKVSCLDGIAGETSSVFRMY
jgi:hypothetical protein